MNKDSLIDYFSCIIFRLLGPIIRILPIGLSLFLGKMLGGLCYYFDLKHKSIAYSNIKTALGNKLSPYELSNLTKDFYQTFGQNLIEIFFVPLINKKYINKYISIEGQDYITEGFKKGKGVILLGVHEGSWELSSIICANLGFPFSLLIRDQRHPRLNKLLNLYRSQKGCKLIQRQNQTRQLIQALKDNTSIGMTADQGGKTGTLVKFFGKGASMPTGAIRMSLKYDAALIPVFYTRLNGPYIKVIVEPPFKIKKSGNNDIDIHDNLQEVIHIFERYILKYSKEYVWSYKIWKYTNEKNILILSDGKTGHLRQTQAAVKLVSNYLKDKGIITHINTVEVRLKNKFAKYALNFTSGLAGKYHCQGCLWCLKTFLKKDTYKSLISIKPDIIISCGSSIAPINFILARENLAKSIVVMRPSVLSTGRFDLVIMPQHDRPPKRKNIVAIEGALNLIDQDYLTSCARNLTSYVKINKGLVIGLLIGGDTKDFRLSADLIKETISQIKKILENLDAEILVTTSRRTSSEVECLVKEEFRDYPRCKLLVIANEKNIPSSIGGILGLSQIIVTSPESISMISEAVNSKKYVIVFNSSGLGMRHQRFLYHFAKNKYIYLNEPYDLSKTIEDIWLHRPQVHTAKDNLLISEAIKKIL